MVGLGATAANAAPGQSFYYVAIVVDENGDAIFPPVDQPWGITAVGGGVTHSNQDDDQGNPFGLVIDDPAAATYTVTVDPYQSGLVSSDLNCTVFDVDAPEAFDFVATGGSSAAGWQIPVSGTLSTSCVETFTAGEPLPDPRFEAVAIAVGGVNPDGSPAAIGEDADFQVALKDGAGTLHAVTRGESISVAPGEYTPVVIAAPDAQPGFDLNAWTAATWYCAGKESFAPGGTVTLTAGTLTTCSTTMVNANVDASLSGDVVGDVNFEFDGVSGAVGTEFEIELVIENDESVFTTTPQALPVDVLVTLGNNMAVRDPFVLTDGFTATLDPATGQYRINGAEALQPGESVTVRLGLVLTGTTAANAFEACLVIPEGVVDSSGQDNCYTAHAVADGGDPTPVPIETVTPAPSPTETVTPAPALTPTETVAPTPTKTPAASETVPPTQTDVAAAPAVNDKKDDNGLAQTGANIAPLVALTLALVAGGAALVTMQKRREQRS
ncbi:hypothetical protein C7K25_06365 [Gulosibacter molinativorax]|uniref:LPXTG cell wall anchor domain-containing protein n=1 Tax=Gulosibacter molinativorax TaxID=256821 RepID=A0ABT7C730_9MICO|nr:hypothetical protein [Gulosibacter molinativorax]